MMVVSIDSDGCQADWRDAQKICRANGGRLPTIDELKKVVTECGGTMEDFKNNRLNSAYQSCYKNKGFASNYYWSSTTYVGYTYYAWNVYFNFGSQSYDVKSDSNYVRCVRAGE
ncbi:MAG: Unknown protein [uncultured Sulfurovum sp.]|uniref:Lcl C-terminal domain-containing protein n=1 Tax=uncultured Sulfurovum sp. TaxID=269237 RepID=A0A6S6SGR0_9BACT|nr:MAG: Unknown protein [uncultured Sulfurovum sp.]